MTLIYRIGDLCDAPEPIIIHGCNAQGVMGSGVARAIRYKWPHVFDKYQRKYVKQGGLNLGQIVWANVEPYKFIGNAITQENYGRTGTRYVDYDAVSKVFAEVYAALSNLCEMDLIPYDLEPAVAIPKIGAGLGGGDWDIISYRIMVEMRHRDVIVYELE